jgi:hypothetical protein
MVDVRRFLLGRLVGVLRCLAMIQQEVSSQEGKARNLLVVRGQIRNSCRSGAMLRALGQVMTDFARRSKWIDLVRAGLRGSESTRSSRKPPPAASKWCIQRYATCVHDQWRLDRYDSISSVMSVAQ